MTVSFTEHENASHIHLVVKEDSKKCEMSYFDVKTHKILLQPYLHNSNQAQKTALIIAMV